MVMAKRKSGPANPGRITDYGFDWGPLSVTRYFHDKRGYLLGITTNTRELQVWVSTTGRSVRAIEAKRRKR